MPLDFQAEISQVATAASKLRDAVAPEGGSTWEDGDTPDAHQKVRVADTALLAAVRVWEACLDYEDVEAQREQGVQGVQAGPQPGCNCLVCQVTRAVVQRMEQGEAGQPQVRQINLSDKDIAEILARCPQEIYDGIVAHSQQLREQAQGG